MGKTSKAQLRATRNYEERNPLKTTLDTAIRQGRRLANPQKGSKLEQAIKENPDKYQEAILNLADMYSEKAREIKGK